jgi:glycosyltransferase involved in cell wall biosynthesis
MLDGRPPVVHTLHGPWTDATRLLYGALAGKVHLVAISDAQRRDNPDVPYLTTVHNGIDLASYTYGDRGGDHLVYIGRANPDKGPVEAIEIARRAGRPLKMILKRNEPVEQEYFERDIQPRLGHDVELYENVPHEEKVEIVSSARAMIFPIRWPEPFGLVMVESLACGTPVITTNWGAAPEIVSDGVTGFRRDGSDDLVAAVHEVDEISRAECRADVERRFSAAAMVGAYEQAYEQVVAATAR